MTTFKYLLLATALFTLLACGEDDGGPLVFLGDTVSVGDGRAWTEVTINEDGSPASVAVVFTGDALENLPAGAAPAHEFLLPMPPGADVAPYDHATLDWNHHGHGPTGVYDLPHFDVHFYFMTPGQRDAITPFDSVAFNAPLPAEQLPPLYIETPGGVPRMGAHIIDATSPEIAGTGPFTHTFIYGKYDGRLNFLEPMVTESFLRSHPDVEAEVRQPEGYGQAGYFPSRYAIRYAAADDTYRVELLGLSRFAD